MQKVKLSNEIYMPELGVEIKNVKEGEIYGVIRWAIKLGVMCFDVSGASDTQINEAGFGFRDVMIEDKIKRNDLFVIGSGGDKIKSLENLGLEYWDLCLLEKNEKIVGDEDIVVLWKELEELYRSEKCKAIGISDFLYKEALLIDEKAEINPMVCKIIRNPYENQKEMIEWGEKNNVIMVEYGLFGKDDKVLDNEVIKEIAKRNELSVKEVCIGWAKEKGVVLPKIQNEDDLKESIKALEIKLDNMDMEMIWGIGG